MLEYTSAEGDRLLYSVCACAGENPPMRVSLCAPGQNPPKLRSEWSEAVIQVPEQASKRPSAARALMDLIHSLCAETGSDEMRLYLCAADEGADAAWSLLARAPRLFAAAVVAGGWGDPYAVRAVKTTPVWCFYRKGDAAPTPRGTARGLADGYLMSLSLKGYGNESVLCEEQTGAAPIEREDVIRWLSSQDRRKQLEINCIRPGLWHMEDYFRASCYLVEGAEKALLIDTGMAEVDLPAVVKRLTRLPVELAVTHAHGDHYANAAGFPVVYMHQRDISAMPYQIRRFQARHPDMPLRKIPDVGAFRPLREGSRIDLGGGVVFETLDLPGHTKGSVAFVCERLGLLFSGDAFGSGEIVLLFGTRDQVPAEIASYRDSLDHFIACMEGRGELLFLGGHRMQDASCALEEQEKIASGGVSYYNPLCMKVVTDMRQLCEEILAGRAEPDDTGSERIYRYGRAGIVYRFEKMP